MTPAEKKIAEDLARIEIEPCMHIGIDFGIHDTRRLVAFIAREVAAAERRGAEAMREQAAKTFDSRAKAADNHADQHRAGTMMRDQWRAMAEEAREDAKILRALPVEPEPAQAKEPP